MFSEANDAMKENWVEGGRRVNGVEDEAATAPTSTITETDGQRCT